MIHIAVCDDDLRYAESIGEEIIRIILKNGLHGNLSVFDSGEKLVEAINCGQAMDILFLDYEMPGIKGSEVAALLRQRDRSFKLVFLSSYEDKAFNLFEHDMSSFVPKIKASELLEPAVNRALKQLMEDRDDLETFTLVRDEYSRENIKISLKDIVYFETAGRHTIMHTNLDGQCFTLGRRTMASLEKEYGPHKFVLIDRGIMVNTTYVRSYGDNYVKLHDDRVLHMTSRKKDAFLDVYMPLLHGK